MAQWQEPETQVVWLAVELAVLLVVVAALVLFTRKYVRNKLQDAKRLAEVKLMYQKRLLNDSIQVQEKERSRFAHDLHDDLISQLNILVLRLHADKVPEKSLTMLQEAMHTARRISHDLSPPLIEENSWEEILENLLERLESHFQVDLFISNPNQKVLDSTIKLQLIRMVQEVLNNSIKYAQCKTIRVISRQSDRYLSLVIADDGQGFDPQSQSAGLGRSNIEMRVQILEGHYRLKSAPHKGTSYLFVIPLIPEKL